MNIVLEKAYDAVHPSEQYSDLFIRGNNGTHKLLMSYSKLQYYIFRLESYNHQNSKTSDKGPNPFKHRSVWQYKINAARMI